MLGKNKKFSCSSKSSNGRRKLSLLRSSRRREEEEGSKKGETLIEEEDSTNEHGCTKLNLLATPPPSNCRKAGKRKCVTFGTVQIGFHAIIMGDHPGVSQGPPITIEWENFDQLECSVDAYEMHRDERPRRGNDHELMIPVPSRYSLLVNTNKISAIKQRVREVNAVKAERAETRMYMYRAKQEEAFERLVRGFKNLTTNRKKKEKDFIASTMY